MDDAERMIADDGFPSEMLWLNDLGRNLPWTDVVSRPMQRCDHINISELRITLKAAATLAWKHPGCRIIVLIDSRVAMGAAGKGRSSSFSLNRVLRSFMLEIIGLEAYIGILFVPSRLQPADAALRLRARVALAPGPLPDWARGVLIRDFVAFDRLAALPKQTKASANSATLAVNCADLGMLTLGQKDLPFDAPLGYPGRLSAAPPRRRASTSGRFAI